MIEVTPPECYASRMWMVVNVSLPPYNLIMKEQTVVSVVTYVELISVEIGSGYA